ncbi:hypothetical protein FQN49_007652 [Arthroderma sp. PD_2]|nr:hypothetical protein FQN49_007652 [Arthroderma sp. PD_2]
MNSSFRTTTLNDSDYATTTTGLLETEDFLAINLANSMLTATFPHSEEGKHEDEDEDESDEVPGYSYST